HRRGRVRRHVHEHADLGSAGRDRSDRPRIQDLGEQRVDVVGQEDLPREYERQGGGRREAGGPAACRQTRPLPRPGLEGEPRRGGERGKGGGRGGAGRRSPRGDVATLASPKRAYARLLARMWPTAKPYEITGHPRICASRTVSPAVEWTSASAAPSRSLIWSVKPRSRTRGFDPNLCASRR